MSLLEDTYENFIIMNKVKMPDGYGGYVTRYVDGITIKGVMDFDSSLQARIANEQGVHSIYTFTTKKSITLEYHDVVKRVRDEKVFRITSDGDDVFTPQGAGLNMRQVTAEEWVLPTEKTDE